jgi:phosphatidylserine/phosphatidylglycerophosphate/cardiolipin synthase-like enzyme
MAPLQRIQVLFTLALLTIGCGGTKTFDEDAPRTLQAPAVTEKDVAVYFSPHGGGLKALLDEINSATKSIDVMAYLITAQEIADALGAAVKRGVDVRVILDADNAGGIFSDKAVFAGSPVPIWRDGEHKEFHHKVMLIDGRVVITGSYNFTSQAENANAENLLLIRDHPKLYSAYLAHFNEHLQHARPPEGKTVSTK